MSKEKQIKTSKEQLETPGQPSKTTGRQVACRTKCRATAHASQQNDRTTTILGEAPIPTPVQPTTFFIFLSNTEEQFYKTVQPAGRQRPQVFLGKK